MKCEWVDCDRNSVKQRYDRIAKFIPVFDRLLFLPRDLRRKAVDRLELSRGDNVLEIGCGTGNSFSYLYDAVGPAGHIYAVDISPGMLREARKLRDLNHWHNVELSECDAADYTAPTPLDGLLFSLSYNTMPHHRIVPAAASSSWTPSTARASRRDNPAFQPLANETHDARQSAHSTVDGNRDPYRTCPH
jgi:trans-aconitate methyltransferase